VEWSKKEAMQLDTHKRHIWSSSTLYSEEIRVERFISEAFLGTHTKLSEVEMYDFHRHAEEGNQENGLVINRDEELKTFSITQAVIERNKVTIFHYDCPRRFQYFIYHYLINTLKLLLHKITHWEYWPFQVIYIPIYFLGFYSMKAKSIFSLMPLIQLSKTEGLLWKKSNL
jgi:hypothetical protein